MRYPILCLLVVFAWISWESAAFRSMLDHYATLPIKKQARKRTSNVCMSKESPKNASSTTIDNSLALISAVPTFPSFTYDFNSSTVRAVVSFQVPMEKLFMSRHLKPLLDLDRRML